MRYQIRENVFESNSSSCHALVYKRKDLEPFNLPLDENGKVHIYLDDEYEPYSGGSGEHYEQREKIKYIITHICNNKYEYNAELLEEDSYDYRNLVDAIKEYEPKFKGFVIHGEGGVNHQLQDRLDEIVNLWDEESVQNFLFNPEIGFEIYND